MVIGGGRVGALCAIRGAIQPLLQLTDLDTLDEQCVLFGVSQSETLAFEQSPEPFPVGDELVLDTNFKIPELWLLGLLHDVLQSSE